MVKKLEWFSKLFLQKKLKKEGAEDSEHVNYYKVRFTLNDLDNMEALTHVTSEIIFDKRKSYGVINSVTYLFNEKELTKLNLEKNIYFSKTAKGQYRICEDDSLGNKVVIALKDVFLIEHEQLIFCSKDMPFGQKSNIEFHKYDCIEKPYKKRKKQIKALLK